MAADLYGRGPADPTWRERWRAWRSRRQAIRCAAGRHHWTSISPDRVMCTDPGCGKRYGG